MNLQQLRYLCALVNTGMAVSEAARSLHTSQPGVSKQLRQLEIEIGMPIFIRGGHRITGLTPVGKEVLDLARRAVAAVDSMRALGRLHADRQSGNIRITTTHSLARFFLPEIIRKYTASHRNVRILVQHAPLPQITEAVASGSADIGVTARIDRQSRALSFRICRTTPRVVLTPKGHPLTQLRRPSLRSIAKFPIIITLPGSTNREEVLRAFEAYKLTPQLVLSVTDNDVVKACVEKGLGVAVLPEYTFDATRDSGLCALPAEHLFGSNVTAVVLRRKHPYPAYATDFVELLFEERD